MSVVSERPSTSARKDVFISYSRCDKQWVDGYLRRLLVAANVQFVIDEQDFEIGVRLDDNIRNLINECRHTLFVMTPDWVRGKWTHFESELAAHDKSGVDGVRVLPLKLKACEVPPHIALRLYLDLTAARTRDEEIRKLLRQIGVPEEKIEHALASVAKKTLWFLIELFTEPQARDELSKLYEMFFQIQQSNDVLQTNKTLHDRLQEMQFPLQQLTELLVDQDLAVEQADWTRGLARGATSALREKLELLVSFAATVPENLVDVTFVEPFTGLADEIGAVFRSRDARGLRIYINVISLQIEQSLPRVNDRIVRHVKERRLSDLVQKLQTVYELVADIEFDDEVIRLLNLFRSGITELVELERGIQEKVDDHETLQNAEVMLHLCSPEDEPTFSDIAKHWARVEKFVTRLKLTDRYHNLLGCSREVNELLNNNEIVRDDRFEDEVQWRFSDFVQEMKVAFNKLDIDLLADCGKLKPLSDKLDELLKSMQNDDV